LRIIKDECRNIQIAIDIDLNKIRVNPSAYFISLVQLYRAPRERFFVIITNVFYTRAEIEQGGTVCFDVLTVDFPLWQYVQSFDAIKTSLYQNVFWKMFNCPLGHDIYHTRFRMRIVPHIGSHIDAVKIHRSAPFLLCVLKYYSTLPSFGNLNKKLELRKFVTRLFSKVETSMFEFVASDLANSRTQYFYNSQNNNGWTTAEDPGLVRSVQDVLFNLTPFEFDGPQGLQGIVVRDRAESREFLEALSAADLVRNELMVNRADRLGLEIYSTARQEALLENFNAENFRITERLSLRRSQILPPNTRPRLDDQDFIEGNAAADDDGEGGNILDLNAVYREINADENNDEELSEIDDADYEYLLMEDGAV
jgi:hypothetical protein